MTRDVCNKCGETTVCRCGQTEPTLEWPCTHGGCLFECPKCAQADMQRDYDEERAHGWSVG
jgi:hypothetical protein